MGSSSAALVVAAGGGCGGVTKLFIVIIGSSSNPRRPRGIRKIEERLEERLNVARNHGAGVNDVGNGSASRRIHDAGFGAARHPRHTALTSLTAPATLRRPTSIFNHLNSAVFLDRSGTNGASGARFYPYGEEITSTGNDREKFATYTRDSYTGLDYAGQRYYASAGL